MPSSWSCPSAASPGLDAPGETAVGLDDPRVLDLLALAAKTGLYIVAGLAEREGERVFNAAVVCGPAGLLGVARQTHVAAADRAWATPGEDFTVVDLPFARLGVMIGHDASFPEIGRVLALRGCDVIACPAAIGGRFHGAHGGTLVAQPEPIPTGPDPLHWHHFRVRGGENNCYFAFANASPASGVPGHSGVFGPDSFAFPRQEAVVSGNRRLAVLTADTGNLGSVYPTHVVRRKDLVLMRQPHHYSSLIAPLAPLAATAQTGKTPALSSTG